MFKVAYSRLKTREYIIEMPTSHVNIKCGIAAKVYPVHDGSTVIGFLLIPDR